MVTQIAFVVLVAAVAVQRLFELRLSARNLERLLARGGREHAAHQMKWMSLLHAAWLVAMPLEVFVADRGFDVRIALLALLVFGCGQALRYAAIAALGDRWCVRVVTVPSEPVRRDGIFSKLRHPNYLGVVLEIAALPLVHGAWLTSLTFSILNAVLLNARIRAEEAALSRDEDYQAAFASGRLWRAVNK